VTARQPRRQYRFEIPAEPVNGLSFAIRCPGHQRSIDDGLYCARERTYVNVTSQFAGRDGCRQQPLDLAATGTCVLNEMSPQDVVGQVILQVCEISQQRVGRWRQIRHAGRIRPQRRERAAVGGPQSSENRTGAPGEAFGQRLQQGAFAAEPLYQPARCDTGLASDVSQGEFVRPATAHGALGRREHLFVCNLLASSGH
jgi:hypothetical protein